MEAVLSIAGSDSSGGAGIQADIKTIAAHRLFAETALTALTAQNTLGVTGVLDVDPAFVTQQIDAVFEDIRPAAVKVGMVSSAAIIEAVADALERHGATNIVVDPVMVATSGARLISEDAVEALKARLLPLADVVTPNMPEAEVLCGVHGARSARAGRTGAGRRAREGRARRRARRRRAGGEHGCSGLLAARRAHRHEEHPRHRLHALIGHRLRPREGPSDGGSSARCEGLRPRRPRLGPGPGTGQRPARSHVE